MRSDRNRRHLTRLENLFQRKQGVLAGVSFYRLYASMDTKQGHSVENLTDFFRETQLVRSDNRLDPTKLSKYERLRRYGNQTAGQPAFVRENGTSATVNDVAEAYIQDGSFYRLREVSLTATLPTNWASKLGAQGGAITVGGQNLGLWTTTRDSTPKWCRTWTSPSTGRTS